MRHTGMLSLALLLGLPGNASAEPARALKVTVLSTMLAGDPGRGIGEWGFAALVEVDGRNWTGEKLNGFGVAHLLGAHCTGIEAVYRLRALLDLPRENAVVAAVESGFTLGAGITALALAR